MAHRCKGAKAQRQGRKGVTAQGCKGAKAQRRNGARVQRRKGKGATAYQSSGFFSLCYRPEKVVLQ
jgi:hypothetical protein